MYNGLSCVAVAVPRCVIDVEMRQNNTELLFLDGTYWTIPRQYRDKFCFRSVLQIFTIFLNSHYKTIIIIGSFV